MNHGFLPWRICLGRSSAHADICKYTMGGTRNRGNLRYPGVTLEYNTHRIRIWLLMMSIEHCFRYFKPGSYSLSSFIAKIWIIYFFRLLCKWKLRNWKVNVYSKQKLVFINAVLPLCFKPLGFSNLDHQTANQTNLCRQNCAWSWT